METIKARVVQADNKYFISIQDKAGTIRIPLSENDSNAVKSAFNKIISRIKAGVFQIDLQDVGEDLFSQVSKEYITQLNREIQEVHSEMEQNGLASD